MKKLTDFPIKADPNHNPLHVVYSCVTFSELITFDLMRLLQSFRAFHRDYDTINSEAITEQHYEGAFISDCENWLKSNSNVKPDEIQSHLDTMKTSVPKRYKEFSHKRKYLKALKAELAKRPNLTSHEKRSLYKIR